MFRSLLDTIKTFFRSVHRSLKQSAARVCETPLCQTQTTCFDPQVTPPDLHHHHTIPREHRCNHLFGYHQHLLHTNLLSPTIPLPSHTTPRTDHHAGRDGSFRQRNHLVQRRQLDAAPERRGPAIARWRSLRMSRTTAPFSSIRASPGGYRISP